MVLIHGGFWRTPFDRELMDPLAEDLAERGFAAWNIDDRRVGDGGGGESWRVTLDDVAASLDQLGALSAEHPLDTDRTALVGHSAGGHLALWLSSEFQVAAAVSRPGSRAALELSPSASSDLHEGRAGRAAAEPPGPEVRSRRTSGCTFEGVKQRRPALGHGGTAPPCRGWGPGQPTRNTWSPALSWQCAALAH